MTKSPKADELRGRFNEQADARFAKLVSTGETIPWADVRKYLTDSLEDKQRVAADSSEEAGLIGARIVI